MDPLPLFDELWIHAKNGLRYADDPCDEHRYERILDLVDYYGETLAYRPIEDVSDRHRDHREFALDARESRLERS